MIFTRLWPGFIRFSSTYIQPTKLSNLFTIYIFCICFYWGVRLNIIQHFIIVWRRSSSHMWFWLCVPGADWSVVCWMSHTWAEGTQHFLYLAPGGKRTRGAREEEPCVWHDTGAVFAFCCFVLTAIHPYMCCPTDTSTWHCLYSFFLTKHCSRPHSFLCFVAVWEFDKAHWHVFHQGWTGRP